MVHEWEHWVITTIHESCYVKLFGSIGERSNYYVSLPLQVVSRKEVGFIVDIIIAPFYQANHIM